MHCYFKSYQTFLMRIHPMIKNSNLPILQVHQLYKILAEIASINRTNVMKVHILDTIKLFLLVKYLVRLSCLLLLDLGFKDS